MSIIRRLFGRQKSITDEKQNVETFEGYGGGVGYPVCCGGGPAGEGPAREHAYLKRLRCPDGGKVRFSRKGSYGGDSGVLVDAYLVECFCGKHTIFVFMDMYTRGKERCVDAEGWTLEEHENRDLTVSGREQMNPAPDFTTENVGSEFLEKMKEHPKLVSFIKDSLKDFGDDPVPKIIQQLIAEGLTVEARAMYGILLSYVGQPAVPHLIKLLGDDNYTLAMFAAKTLPSIEGSLQHVIKALKSEDPKTRLHAAGSLQYFGSEAIHIIPDLCEFIKSEIIKPGETELQEIPEAAGIAAGALGRMGKAALTMSGDLLKNDNVNVRLIAVSALLRIGKPALPLLLKSRSKEKDQLVFTALQNAIRRIEREN